jgi:DNA-binding transcriptional ArsR family regulator
LVAALEALGLSSVRELAAHLGRSPQSLYFHLRPLLESGLVEEAGERVVGRRTEHLYRLVGTLRIAGDVTDPDYGHAMAEMCRSITRAAERDYCRAIEEDGACLLGRRRNLSQHHYHVHLTPRDRSRFLRMLDELDEFLLSHNAPGRGELLSYTALAAPVRRKPPREAV